MKLRTVSVMLLRRFLRGGTHSVATLAGEDGGQRRVVGDRLRGLAQSGLIEPVGQHATDVGNRATAYRITDAGREAYARSVARLRGAA